MSSIGDEKYRLDVLLGIGPEQHAKLEACRVEVADAREATRRFVPAVIETGEIDAVQDGEHGLGSCEECGRLFFGIQIDLFEPRVEDQVPDEDVIRPDRLCSRPVL